jgi:hypothetical protein
MDLNKPIPVKVDLYWAFLNEPNQMSEKYQVDLCNLSKEAVKKLMDIGVEVKNDERKAEQGFYVTAKSKMYPILAVDPDGRKIDVKVANGSKGVAFIKPYEYTFKGKKAMGVGVSKIVIQDLIVYEKDEVSMDDLNEAV